MSHALAALAVASLWLLGVATLVLWVRGGSSWPLAARLGLPLPAGLVCLALLMLLVSRAGRPIDIPLGLSAGLALLVGAAWVGPDELRGWLAPGHARPTDAGAPVWAGRALAAALAALCLGVCASGLLEPLVHWDVLSIWGYKARLLVHESLADTAYLGDVSRGYSHLDYPLLWPFGIGWVLAFAGPPDVSAVKLLGVALFLAFLASFHGLLVQRVARIWALLFTAWLASIPVFQSFAMRMLADAPLALFLLLCGAAGSHWLETRDRRFLRLAGLGATGLLLCKNEGMPLFALVGVSAAAVLLAGGRRRELPAAGLWLGLLPAVLTAPWFALRRGIPRVHEDMASRLDPALALQQLERLPGIAGGALRYLAEPRDWLLTWPLVAVVLLLAARELRRPSLAFPCALAQGTLLLYGAAYWISPWPLERLMEVSLSRLALHAAPLEIFLVALAADRAGLLPELRATPPATAHPPAAPPAAGSSDAGGAAALPR